MTMMYIFENYYNDLTQEERDYVTTCDLQTANYFQFDSVEDFKECLAFERRMNNDK